MSLSLKKLASREVSVLKLEGPPSDGLNVGTGRDAIGKYRWEGEVKEGKAHGFGAKTFLSWIDRGCVMFGEYREGKIWGKRVGIYPGGRMRYYPHPGCIYLDFDSSDAEQTATLEKAREKSAAARALVCVPWSPTTNYFIKWKPIQDMVLTVMLVGERLHRTDRGGLCPLPVEIWEKIIQLALTD
eukprot:m.47931 g.47931  ORF g.47931 m.47931 type:complete len:185 (+) comp10542_c0_seq1:326-880(+)